MKIEQQVPFFRPLIGEPEIAEVIEVLRSGWMTTGPRVKRFENDFAAAVGGRHAVALNSCTAALHLALEALGVQPKDAVLVPTMTFASTAEVVRYLGSEPVLVDCDPVTLLMDVADAEVKIQQFAAKGRRLVGVIPVHVGGLMLDMDAVNALAKSYGLWVVEDAAHSFPAAWRPGPDSPWRWCGCGESEVTCFSFYANKTITTGEGGMAVTQREHLAERMRIMSLHGISKDAWKRYMATGSWYYEIIEPGFKYNMTDMAAAVGIHQLARAEAMRREREVIAGYFMEQLADVAEIELPPVPSDRIHSWHLFYIRLRLERLAIDRATFMEELKQRGVLCTVHWQPLHFHPYYREVFGYQPQDLPRAAGVWPRLISLPIFPGMTDGEKEQVVAAVREVARVTGKG
jgi:perosamine synthetase